MAEPDGNKSLYFDASADPGADQVIFGSVRAI
jgi:hypothetical protein